jgi:hypothetical protein
MDFFTSNRFDILLGVVIALCTAVAEFLEAQYSQEEKREFARTLNQRWFQRENLRSPVSVFQAVFDSADTLLSKFFGSKIFTIRSIYLSFIASTSFTIVNIGLLYFIIPQKNYHYLTSYLYNGPVSLLIFLIFFLSSGFTAIISVIQTRFFLNIFRIFPTGAKFAALAYCDMVLTTTIFIFLFLPAVSLAIFLADSKLIKAVPIEVLLYDIEPYPDDEGTPSMYVSFLSKYVEGSTAIFISV